MKRDMDLIRKILFFIEENYKPSESELKIEIDGTDVDTLFEHCKLAYNAGLIEEFYARSMDYGTDFAVGNLTNEGYDFLDQIREDSFWNKLKTTINQEFKSLSIEVIKAYLTRFIM